MSQINADNRCLHTLVCRYVIGKPLGCENQSSLLFSLSSHKQIVQSKTKSIANSRLSFSVSFSIFRRSRNTFFLGLSRLRCSVRRNPAEMSHTCRGTISLHGALIHTVDACTFVVSNGGTQTFHIKAATEVERQQWVTALELAKAKAIKAMESGLYPICHPLVSLYVL